MRSKCLLCEQRQDSYSIYVPIVNCEQIVFWYCLSNICGYQLSDHFSYVIVSEYGPGSSVGIVTDYGLGGLGSNPGGDEIFRPSRPALGPTELPVQWVLGLSLG